MKPKCSFRAFFKMWADRQKWEVPAIHYRMCDFLEHSGNHAVMMVFRGCGKSTILGVYNAWLFYCFPHYRILHQGDQDKTAFKTSRDTKSVLMRHPLTKGMGRWIRGEASFWWTPQNKDERNPSMQASGIMTNITSSRADQCQNDDVEVQKNVETPEAREKLDLRLSEQIHIAVPGAKHLFVGTPHTHDSKYNQEIDLGAESLVIPLFENEKRFEETHTKTIYEVGFVPDLVFSGIHKESKVLIEGQDYTMAGTAIVFDSPPLATIDCYLGNAWPERFTQDEMISRRRRCKTFNYWDSQYQLHAKPITEVRLDPDKLPVYHDEPMVGIANRTTVMYLGESRIAGMACTWDPASGKINSDRSVLNITLQDDHGCRYWHRSERLLGDIAEYDDKGERIVAGQVHQICNLVEQFNIPRIKIESNGVGQFAPTVLQAALKQRNVRCAVQAENETGNKNQRILGEIQGPLDAGKLKCHASVYAEVKDQMRQWNPKVKDQVDDDLDALAKSIRQEPERVRARGIAANESGHTRDWRPNGGSHEVTVDLGDFQ